MNVAASPHMPRVERVNCDTLVKSVVLSSLKSSVYLSSPYWPYLCKIQLSQFCFFTECVCLNQKATDRAFFVWRDVLMRAGLGDHRTKHIVDSSIVYLNENIFDIPQSLISLSQ